MKTLNLFTILFYFLLGITASAQIPHTMSYQGILTDNNGIAVKDGTYKLKFDLYKTISGGSSIWEEVQNIEVKKGVFNIVLGKINPLDIPFDKPYWLGISVGNNNELTPRVSLNSSAYSFSANSIAGNGKVVKSINNLTDSVMVLGEGGAAVITRGDTIFISAGQASGGGISAIQDPTFSLDIVKPTGPTTNISVSNGGIFDHHIARNQVVKSLQGLRDNITLVKGDNVNITTLQGPGVNQITISALKDGKMTGDLQVGGEVYAKSLHVVANGDTLTSFNSDGTSFHKGHEKFAGGVDFLDTTGKVRIGFKSNGMAISDSLGRPRVYLTDSFFLTKDSSGRISSSLNFDDGTSFHKGLETFAGGIDVESSTGDKVQIRGNGLTFPDGSVQTTASSDSSGWKLDRFGTTTDHSARIKGKLTVIDGIDAGGEISAASLHIVNQLSGDTLVDFFADGTSKHKGLETYEAGLKVTNNDGSSAIELVPNTDPQTEYGLRVNGNVMVSGILNAGIIQAETKQFRIDDPLDPEHKYLNHTSVESSEMKNVYDGEVELDRNGEAVVSLPEWFQALNIDYRYQLTCIGGYAPVYVKEEIHNNRFTISGGREGLKVCWLVTGVRNDKFARENRMKVITDK